MGVTIDLHAERLDCGSGLADLIEQVATDRATERTTHQASCTYCQAALAEIALHWEPIRRHAAQPVPIPPGLLPAIVVRIHRLAGTGRYAVTQAERGVTRLATWALNRLVAHAAGQVRGVSDVTGTAVTVLSRPPQRPRIRVHLEIIGDQSVRLPETAEEIRRSVHHEIAQHTAIHITAIDIEVDDVATDT